MSNAGGRVRPSADQPPPWPSTFPPPGEEPSETVASLVQGVYSTADQLRAVIIVEDGGSSLLPTLRGLGDHRAASVAFRVWLNWWYNAEGYAVVNYVKVEPVNGSVPMSVAM